MALALADKLRIKDGDTLFALNEPFDFRPTLKGLPKGVQFLDNAKSATQVHWFVKSKVQLEKEMSRVMKMLKPGMIVWVYYPKGSSGIQTDLTRDKGWECLLAEGDKVTWISLISFNETWSVFGFRPKTEEDRKKEEKKKPEREIFSYVNPNTKEIKLPDDLAGMLKKDKSAATFFETLSFTNKKEYVEWIVTAKREETRSQRLIQSLERLRKKWKNPANR